MPSQRTVALSLDEETLEIWKSLPAGERSQRVRDALRTAEIVADKDMRIDAMAGRIEYLEKQIADMKLYQLITIEKGDKLVIDSGVGE